MSRGIKVQTVGSAGYVAACYMHTLSALIRWHEIEISDQCCTSTSRLINPVTLRMVRTQWSSGYSECNRVNNGKRGGLKKYDTHMH